jgi:uncharacterized protein (TIGR02284 family)
MLRNLESNLKEDVMKFTNEELEKRLQDIFEKNVDARKGYDNAAENAESYDLRFFFQNKSKEREAFNQELLREISAHYGEPDTSGSATGALHRTWMDIKSFFSGNSDESMLEECIRGDTAAAKEYEEILENEDLPMTIATIIRDQNMRIQADLNKIKSLEDLEKVE